MKKIELAYSFWINFDGSYAELVQEFEEAYGNRWRYDKPIAEVSPKDRIYYNGCEIAITPCDDKHPVYPEYSIFQIFSKAGLDVKHFNVNYRVDFFIHPNSDTPKTRSQLKLVAENLPGNDVLLSNNFKWTFGVRKDGVWEWAEDEDLPWLSKHFPKDIADLETEDEIIREKLQVFFWEKYSIFDNDLTIPFSQPYGVKEERLDFKIEFDGDLVTLMDLIGANLPSDFVYYLREDLERKYYELKFSFNNHIVFTCIFQPSDNFIFFRNSELDKNTFLLSLYKNYGPEDSSWQNEKFVEILCQAITKSNLNAELFEDFKLVETFE